MEVSLRERVEMMNRLGFTLSERQGTPEYQRLSRFDKDQIWLVADGLAEAWVMKHIDGRVSLAAMLTTSLEMVEEYVEDRIRELERIEHEMK